MARLDVNRITQAVVLGMLARELGDDKSQHVSIHVRRGWCDARFRKLFRARGSETRVHVDLSVTIDDPRKLDEIMPDLIQACADLLNRRTSAVQITTQEHVEGLYDPPTLVEVWNALDWDMTCVPCPRLWWSVEEAWQIALYEDAWRDLWKIEPLRMEEENALAS